MCHRWIVLEHLVSSNIYSYKRSLICFARSNEVSGIWLWHLVSESNVFDDHTQSQPVYSSNSKHSVPRAYHLTQPFLLPPPHRTTTTTAFFQVANTRKQCSLQTLVIKTVCAASYLSILQQLTGSYDFLLFLFFLLIIRILTIYRRTKNKKIVKPTNIQHRPVCPSHCYTNLL